MEDKIDKDGVLNLVIKIAAAHDNIRGVLLNGSRVNSSIMPDAFQDYDIVFIVNNVALLVHDEQWLEPLGERLITQKPDDNDPLWKNNNKQYTYLMLFQAGYRIDLKLYEKTHFLNTFKNSLSLQILDKDQILMAYTKPSDIDYLPRHICEQEFYNACNEFLWCAQNVVKGLCRKELPYAKYMLDTILQQQLTQLLCWYAAIRTDFNKNIGAFGRFLEQYLEPDIWAQYCQTFSDSQYTNVWKALFAQFTLMRQVSIKISDFYNFSFDEDEFFRVLNYIKHYFPNLIQSSIEQTVYQLECQLLDENKRKSKDFLSSIVSEDFFEIGRSGRCYNKKDILDHVPSETSRNFAINDFKAQILCENTILTLYKTIENHIETFRTSIWQQYDGKWHIIFHQGTDVISR